MNELKEDFRQALNRVHIERMTDEELAACLMALGGDPDAPGQGITTLPDRELSVLMLRKAG